MDGMSRIKVFYYTEDVWKEHDLASRLPKLAEPQVMFLTFPKERVKRGTGVDYMEQVSQFFAADQKELREKFTHYSTEKEKARLWLIANPKRRKSNLLSFLTNWMLRSAPANKGVEVRPVIRSL